MKNRISSGGWLVCVAAICPGLGACNDKPSESTKIEDLPYTFPRADLDRVVLPKDGMLYVRLKESPSDYMLILDSMVDRAERERGRPVVANLNYSSYAATEVVESVGGPVICRDRAGFNCGFRINDSGIRWSVLLKRDDIENVKGIKISAQKKLQTYRKD